MSFLAISFPFLDALKVVILLAIGSCLLATFICHCIYYIWLKKLNNNENIKSVSAYAAARSLLDVNDMKNVSVRETSKLRMLLQASGYASLYQTIFLHPSMQTRKSIAAVGKAAQCVGFGLQDKWKTKNMRITKLIDMIFPYLPVVFAMVVLIGFSISLAMMLHVMVSYIAFIVIGVLCLMYAIHFIFRLPVNQKANSLGMKMLTQSAFLNENERIQVRRLFVTEQGGLWIHFILSVLLVIEMILQLIGYFFI